MNRLFETTFILNGTLEDTALEASAARVEEFITKNGGTIASKDVWGRKRMAYPIGKKTSGYYVHVQFNAEATLPALLERFYNLDDQFLRYLTLQVTKKMSKGREAMKTRMVKIMTRVAAEAEAAKTAQ